MLSPGGAHGRTCAAVMDACRGRGRAGRGVLFRGLSEGGADVHALRGDLSGSGLATGGGHGRLLWRGEAWGGRPPLGAYPNEQFLAWIEVDTGSEFGAIRWGIEQRAPSMAADPHNREWWARMGTIGRQPSGSRDELSICCAIYRRPNTSCRLFRVADVDPTRHLRKPRFGHNVMARYMAGTP